MAVIVTAVVVTVFLTNITLRSVERNLPNTLIQELLDLALVVEDLRETAFVAEATKNNPSPENFSLLRTKVNNVYYGVVKLREGYVFDNLVQASSFHAVVAPAITDVEVWLSEGVSGYGPETGTTAEIIWLRISEAFNKARALNQESQILAQKMLDEETRRLDRFLFSVNLLFMLTLVVTFVMALLFVWQHVIQNRENKARTELQHQRDLLNSLFENVLLGVTVWDRRGALLHANRGFTEITGYSTAEIRSLDDWFPRAYPDSEYREMVFDEWKRGTGLEGGMKEFKVHCRNGGVKDIEFRGSILPDGRILITMADITERKEAEAEREKLQLRLQHSQKMEAIGTLASGVAHDFNNILQAISGNIQVIQSVDDLDPRIEKCGREIDRAVFRASDLVQRLLTSSRKVEPKLRPLDVKMELVQALGMLERTIPKMILIESQVPPDIRMIYADAGQFSQVILNLATNARDALPEGGRFSIQAVNVSLDAEFCTRNMVAAPGEYVRFTVTDNGLGMDEATMKNIFNPFFTTKDIGKGTGLGLTVVYGIIKNHGGYITCDSKPGQGTTFTIYWPVAPDEKMESEQEAARSEAAVQGSELILVVDDEAAVLDTAAELLGDFGYSVIRAGSGEEALGIYKSKGSQIDLIIMDLGMPGLGGLRTMELLLETDPEVKVVVASGYSSDNQRKEALAAGAAGFVAKPYKINHLVNTIKNVMDGAG